MLSTDIMYEQASDVPLDLPFVTAPSLTTPLPLCVCFQIPMLSVMCLTNIAADAFSTAGQAFDSHKIWINQETGKRYTQRHSHHATIVSPRGSLLHPCLWHSVCIYWVAIWSHEMC